MQGDSSSYPHMISPHRGAAANDGNSSTGGSGVPLSPNDSSGIVPNEESLCHALGISLIEAPHTPGLGGKRRGDRDSNNNPNGNLLSPQYEEEEEAIIVPNPEADQVDLSILRGTRAPPPEPRERIFITDDEGDEDLEALAELVPALKSRAGASHAEDVPQGMTMDGQHLPESLKDATGNNIDSTHNNKNPSDAAAEEVKDAKKKESSHIVLKQVDSMTVEDESQHPGHAKVTTSKDEAPSVPEVVEEEGDSDDVSDSDSDGEDNNNDKDTKKMAPSRLNYGDEPFEQNLGGFEVDDNGEVNDADADSAEALDSSGHEDSLGDRLGREQKAKSKQDYRGMSSNASLSTATQTHEVRMPMYLPTFKPATGCTNASDFIVRCFVARLRSGITVVKHGRSRFCKSRLRILHIHPDGRSLSWKPAMGEPTSSKRPPKLDLSICTEVRHAWSPDPLYPMFTGTPILRQKCEAANAHKSFALIFPKRTVDITAVTADQCKVLMEGFSALCFRLQMANLAGKKNKGATDSDAGDSPFVDGASTTASATLTNTSTQLSPASPGAVKPSGKRGTTTRR